MATSPQRCIPCIIGGVVLILIVLGAIVAGVLVLL